MELGLIGAGWIGGIHADRLTRCPGARVKLVYDVNTAAAARLADQYGCAVVSSVEQACAEADALIIASSTASHLDVGLACVQAGKPFLVEKPVAQDLASAIALRDAAAESGVPACVGFNRRFDERYRAMKEAVAAGRTGAVESIRVAAKTSAAPSPEFLRTSGGLFGEFGIHFFDLARWICGREPEAVIAAGSTLVNPAYREIEQVDTAGVIVRMRGGALFQLDIGWRSAYGHDERIEVFGAAGVVTAGDPVVALPLPGDPSDDRRERLPDWFERFEPTYAVELAAFVDALATGAKLSPSLHDGVVAQAMAEAARESVRTGSWVVLDPGLTPAWADAA